ncbi:MAG TPA: type II toxin-antitoxin system VapC family toxin [Spirochaetia bacterium]|nr:type II toxin-antitoxin system VapC family toxin [Spirochaetia bacterium]
MRTYVDSSIVLRYILNDDPALKTAQASDAVGSSDLLVIECQRVLQRERMAAHLDDQQYAECVALLEDILGQLHLIEIGPAVKRRAAGPFPTVIGTLDAIHLASALLWADAEPENQVAILTLDKQLALCARTLGLRVA